MAYLCSQLKAGLCRTKYCRPLSPLQLLRFHQDGTVTGPTAWLMPPHRGSTAISEPPCTVKGRKGSPCRKCWNVVPWRSTLCTPCAEQGPCVQLSWPFVCTCTRTHSWHSLEVQVNTMWHWWQEAISVKHGAGSGVQAPGFRTTFAIRDDNRDPLQWIFLLCSSTSTCALLIFKSFSFWSSYCISSIKSTYLSLNELNIS